eukprot:NODE_419_length_7785_cov_0.861158.p5 type:complete len:151 gc:universal NODE_419_length_7785_cov_0.861158:4162-3710(-)
MFFIVCPTYPPVAFEQTSEVNFRSLLPKSNSFCVFAQEIPENHFARVFVLIETWEQLGILTPQKLSAFFRVKGLVIKEIGIQLEIGIPPQIEVQTNTSLSLTAHIAKKLLDHLQNYVLSFAATDFIPLSVFQNWISNVQGKLNSDPHFLE